MRMQFLIVTQKIFQFSSSSLRRIRAGKLQKMLLQQRADRIERAVLVIRRTPAFQDARLCPHRFLQQLNAPRFSDASLPLNKKCLSFPAVALLPELLEEHHFPFSSDKGCKSTLARDI